MSTLTFRPFSLGFNSLNTGSSSAAKSLDAIALNAIRQFKTAPAEKGRVLDELEELRHEASRTNWDNLGSASMDEPTYKIASRFLMSLPTNLPAPELTVDRDGEVNFDWMSRGGKNFSVSLRFDGRIAYAGQFSARKRVSGTEDFNDAVPKEVLAGIKEV